MNKKHLGLFVGVSFACVPAIAAAAGPTLSDIFVNSGITASGYIDASYEATFNKYGDGGIGANTVPLHAFDNDPNSFVANQAALTLSYLPTEGFGGLVNVIAGEDAKIINGSYGSGSGDFALTQAYVQYAKGAFTVIGGRFVTLAGAEVIDDTKNANISRSLLFTNAEPLVHTGVRASYKFNDMLTGYLGASNSALSGLSADLNKQKTGELGFAFTPTSAIAVNIADYYGVDGSGPTQTKNNFLDLVASWQATSQLQFVLNGDYVRSIGTTATVPAYLLGFTPSAGAPFPGNDTLAGVAGYVNYTFNDSWKASLRAEHLYIKGKADDGAGQATTHVSELTATVDYTAAKNFDVLAEGRVDYGSDLVLESGGFSTGVPIFPNGSDTRKSQPEVLIKAIYKFGTPTGT
jgi:hypothetical protein